MVKNQVHLPKDLMMRYLRSRGSRALFDQIIVSGTNFVSSIVLVRGLGLKEFGKYALAYVIFLYVNDMQRDPLVVPMMSIGSLLSGSKRKRFADGMLTLQICASGIVFALSMGAGQVLQIFSDFYSLRVICAFSCCLAVYQLQDWVRRYYFFSGNQNLAIVNDVISYGGQLAAFVVLWRIGRLTLFSTYVAMCLTSLAAIIMILFTDRLRPAVALISETWDICRRQSWNMLANTQVRWLGTQGMMFIGNSVVGPSVTGGLWATLNLSGPVNLIMTSLDNFVPLQIGDRLRNGGPQAAFVLIRRSCLTAVPLFAIAMVPVAVFGHQILRFLYGPAMVAFFIPMLLQLTNMMLSVVTRLVSHLYRGLHETRVMLQASILSACAIFASIYPFSRHFGAAGIVTSGLVGQVLIVVYYALYWQTHKSTLLAKNILGGPGEGHLELYTESSNTTPVGS
jgi:O-antigen/teichoic acid export membrane protein